MKKVLIILVASLFVFTACSDDDVVTDSEKGNEVEITTSINGISNVSQLGLRAYIDSYTGEGGLEYEDKINLFIIGSRLRLNTSYLVGITRFYWNDLIAIMGESSFNFVSLYPYQVGVSVPGAVFNAAQAINPDLLYAHATGVTKGSPVNLVFNHIMHKLVINLSSNYYNASQIASATFNLKNLKSGIYINLTAPYGIGEVSGSDSYPTKSGSSVSFIIVPQSLTVDTEIIDITIEGRTFTYKVPPALSAFESGKVFTLNLSINRNAVGRISEKSNLDILSSNISSWKDSTAEYQSNATNN